MSVNCIHLLNVLLALRPNRRLSLEPIMKHPWFNKGYLGEILTSNEEPPSEDLKQQMTPSTPTDDAPECIRGPPIEDGNDAKISSI
ncbi:serine/threonine-protein kinase par-1 [Bombina bombina]|uniref:serine/threonine-protein kinase par-1 n=1 Tax=Bombina bombina TaxID=8345 RepID=UPI00235A6B8A|nr:serine/threonine-protein kinase par-1 [Bombina bombina]